MKNQLILVLVIIFVSGCTQMNFDVPEKISPPSGSNAKYNVNLKCIEYFLKMTNKSEPWKKYNITPIIYQNDTLLYIVNFENDNGWQIISGDKRTQPVLATDKKGAFRMSEVNPSLTNWLEDLANSLYELKSIDECDSTKAEFQMWNNIQSLVSGKPDKILAPTNPEGYWELVSCTYELILPLQVGPYVQTKWTQMHPWNAGTPFSVTNYSSYQDYQYFGSEYAPHCPVGCAALAGAQMLKYLHDKIGKPVSAYASINYNGGYLKYNSLSFDGYQPFVWNLIKMNKDDDANPYLYSQILLAYVANGIKTEFGKNESRLTDLNNLKTLFNREGISCNIKDYSYSDVCSNLLNGMPVITTGNENRINHYFIGFIDVNNYEYTEGHAWIINGWQSNFYKITYRYNWVQTSAGSVIFENKASKVASEEEYEYTTYSTYYYFLMKWGWDGDFDDASYLTDNYFRTVSHNYQYNRKIICDFK